MPHLTRELFRRATPVHVTLRVVNGLPSLRRKQVYGRMLHCFETAKRSDFQVVRHSVQGNHLHLIVEADSKEALSRGMQGLGIRLAKRINRIFKRTGQFFSDRYHAHVLRTPREVINAVRYLLQNGRKHRRQAGLITGPRWRDAFCSRSHDRPPETWLLRNATDTG
ncbi:MAG: transposase [Myxococcota bacterium]